MIQDKRLQYICSVDDCDYFIFKAHCFATFIRGWLHMKTYFLD